MRRNVYEKKKREKALKRFAGLPRMLEIGIATSVIARHYGVSPSYIVRTSRTMFGIGARRPMRKKGTAKVDIVCQHCGITFKGYEYPNKPVRYCTRKCASIVRWRNRKSAKKARLDMIRTALINRGIIKDDGSIHLP